MIIVIVLRKAAIICIIEYTLQIHTLFHSGTLCIQVVHHACSDGQVAHYLSREDGDGNWLHNVED